MKISWRNEFFILRLIRRLCEFVYSFKIIGYLPIIQIKKPLWPLSSKKSQYYYVPIINVGHNTLIELVANVISTSDSGSSFLWILTM